MSQAGRELNINVASISLACGVGFSAGGFIWIKDRDL